MSRSGLLAAAVEDGFDDALDAGDVKALAKVLGHLSGVCVLLLPFPHTHTHTN